ncbi:MAG: hypothetical protein M3032_06660 [Verrucomicrobiota bacterium]|nr:hypothetical protein [Verrucomicrobiota bacterium]
MKPVHLALSAALLLGVFGCANEGPTSEELGQQLSRGVRGEGQVTPDVDRSDDPYVKPRGGRDNRPEGSG